MLYIISQIAGWIATFPSRRYARKETNDGQTLGKCR